MTRDLLKILAAASALLLADCQNANDAAYIPMHEVFDPASSGRTAVVMEDTGILPLRGPKDDAGPSLNQVDLAKNHDVMVGLNPAFLADYRVPEADIVKDRVAPDAPMTRFTIFNAPQGASDYALTYYYRTDGRMLENRCYYQNAIVYRLKPGVINYIPKEMQPPLYNWSSFDAVFVSPDTRELRRVLARFPLAQMEIATPQIVAIVKFSPNKLGSRCDYNEDFAILKQR
jgi:hypothetical protein